MTEILDTYVGDPIGSVYPSDETSVWMSGPTDEYGGAHHYTIKNSRGFSDGKAQSGDGFQQINFVKKLHDGTMLEGAQSEQLVLILIDRTKKLNSVYPSPQNEKMIHHLQGYLDACKERIDDRINRGVMGDLKK